jgi:hypothetical protein
MPPRATGLVTLVSGTDFVLCDPDGDIVPGGTEGYYAGDTRLVSSMEVRFDGAELDTLQRTTNGKELVVLGSAIPLRPTCSSNAGSRCPTHCASPTRCTVSTGELARLRCS